MQNEHFRGLNSSTIAVILLCADKRALVFIDHEIQSANAMGTALYVLSEL